MKGTAMKRTTILILAAVVLMAADSVSFAKPSPDFFNPCMKIVESNDLSKEQKLEELRKYIDSPEVYISSLIYWMDRVDHKEAIKTGEEYFNREKITTRDKLEVGKRLVEMGDTNIIPPYKKFLVDEIVNNIGEFMKEREDYAISAVGEYSSMAAGFNGYKKEVFESFKDPRVIPNLITALGAPDEVYRKREEQGCVKWGEPGTSTGRNMSRQNIPVGLLRLNATAAIPALKKTLETHHDYYLKHNCAYALGYLLEKEQKQSYLKLFAKQNNNVRDRESHIFTFVTGMIGSGDMDGLEFLGFLPNDPGTDAGLLLSCINTRLSFMKDFRNAKTMGFYKMLLENKPFRNILAGDIEKTKFDVRSFGGLMSLHSDGSKKTKEEIYTEVLPRFCSAYKAILDGISLNGFWNLKPLVEETGMNSKDQQIRDITKDFLSKAK
jgi:hypothetical protein